MDLRGRKEILKCISENTGDPISFARKKYDAITAYQVTLRSRGLHFSEEIRYFYKAGFIKMEFIRPFPGIILIYNPVQKEVRLKPLKIAGRIMSLSPDNPLIRSSAGHRIDESDIGSLLKAIATLQSHGETFISGTQCISGQQVLQIRITGSGSFAFRGIHQYDLWLDNNTYLPIKAVSYYPNGDLIEELFLDDLITDPELPDELFCL